MQDDDDLDDDAKDDPPGEGRRLKLCRTTFLISCRRQILALLHILLVHYSSYGLLDLNLERSAYSFKVADSLLEALFFSGVSFVNFDYIVLYVCMS